MGKVASRLRHSGDRNFAILEEKDGKFSHIIVNTLVDRDTLPEWARTPKMEVKVISEGKTYELGLDITIAGQVWTPLANGNFVTLDSAGQPFGYVPLDSEGKIDSQYLGALFINNSTTVTDQAAMLALTTIQGDLVTVASEGQSYYKLNNNDPSTLADFQQILNGAAVQSVNGQVGVVNITLAGLLQVGANVTAFNSAVADAPVVTEIEAIIAQILDDLDSLAAGEGIDLSNYYTKEAANALLNSKVDKEIGKGLSTEDFTTEHKEVVETTDERFTTVNSALLTKLSISGPNYIATRPTSSATNNGIHLTEIINSANNAATQNNPINVIVFPGIYQLATGDNSAIQLSNYVSIIGFGSKESIVITTPYILGNGLIFEQPLGVDNIRVENITIDAVFLIHSQNISKSIYRNLKIGAFATDDGFSGEGTLTLNGLFEDIQHYSLNSLTLFFAESYNLAGGIFRRIISDFENEADLFYSSDPVDGVFEYCNIRGNFHAGNSVLKNCILENNLILYQGQSTASFNKVEIVGDIVVNSGTVTTSFFYHCVCEGVISQGLINAAENGYNSWETIENTGIGTPFVTVPTSFVVGDVLGSDENGDFAIAGTNVEMCLLVVQTGKAITPGQSYDLGLPIGNYFYNETTQELTLTQPTAEGEVVRPAYIQGNGFGVFLYSQGYQMAGELQFDDESTTLDESFEI